MLNQQEHFNLTEEDIQRTEKNIAAFDMSREQTILSLIPQKLQLILNTPDINNFTIELINDVSKLYNIVMSSPSINNDLKRKILYALDYFVDNDDEIPDEIPVFGYLDDLAVVRYIVNQIFQENPDIFQY